MLDPENIKTTHNLQVHNAKTDAASQDTLANYFPYILDVAQEGIWIWDAQGTTIYVNRQMALLLGTTIEDLMQKTKMDFLFEEDQQTHCGTFQDYAGNNKTSYECRYRRTNGSERWTHVTVSSAFDRQGNYLGTVAMHTDITAQKTSQIAFEKSQEDMHVILESVRDYAIIIIDKDRYVLSWNTGAEEIFGYSGHEIIGRQTDVLYTPEDLNDSIPAKEVETALNNGHSDDDRWLKHKDGSLIYVTGVLTPLNQKDGHVRFVKISRNATAQRNIEEMLVSADRHKNEFLATLAHELRNPLASIHSGVEVLQQVQDDETRKQTQEKIEKQVQQMIHLVNDLLDIARISQGKMQIKKQAIELQHVINHAVDSSRLIIEGYKHALTVSMYEEPILVYADFTRLSQVFLNILVNAAKYTPPGGRITLTCLCEDHTAMIRIHDNGIGIPVHMLSHIFNMFEQVQDRHEYPQAGLGIGLSVVKQLVEMHDGQVEAYSEGTGKGSEFVVKLPICNGHELLPQPDTIVPEKSTSKQPPVNRRILLVDDNADAADLMEILLKKKGYMIQKAYDGKSGIKAAVEFNPEIVLLDLGLPDIDGYQVLKTLKEKLGNRLFIALSGWGQEEDLIRSKEAGFDHHLVKPVDIRTIDELLTLAE